jgi:predicted PhzF superfamily epimerase YddE/YHI9
MGQVITQVDAFTNQPFAGNPAAVCILRGPAAEPWMRAVAREMNLSETAFLYPENGVYQLRWFTPSVEVVLCGHATLASAHVLWTEGHLPHGDRALFETRSGRLSAVRQGDWIELDFPAMPPSPCDAPAGLGEGLGADLVWTGRNGMDDFVELASEVEVRGLKPDMGKLRAVGGRGIIVTSRSSDPRFDFVSRFFAPAAGIDEDPVTGSAHCALAPFWAARSGKLEMVGFQASDRGGIVRVRVAGDRVMLGGQAVSVLRGELLEAASSGKF